MNDARFIVHALYLENYCDNAFDYEKQDLTTLKFHSKNVENFQRLSNLDERAVKRNN